MKSIVVEKQPGEEEEEEDVTPELLNMIEIKPDTTQTPSQPWGPAYVWTFFVEKLQFNNDLYTNSSYHFSGIYDKEFIALRNTALFRWGKYIFNK